MIGIIMNFYNLRFWFMLFESIEHW